VLRSALPLATDTVPDEIVWPPDVVIDLRSEGEMERVHPLAATGARIVHLPLLSALRPDVARPANLHGLYIILLDFAAGHLVDLVREVSVADGATLIHCAAGKDRTGVSIALILRLVGVSREDILTDYRATEAAVEHIDARLRELPGRENRDALPAVFFTVSSDALEGVLDVWDGHEGGVRGWFRGVGGDDELIEQLSRTLIE